MKKAILIAIGAVAVLAVLFWEVDGTFRTGKRFVAEASK
jgi:hypothetical protein